MAVKAWSLLSALVIVVAIVTAFSFTISNSKRDVHLGKPLLAPASIPSIRRIEIKDNQGKLTITNAGGGRWVLPDEGNFPAEAKRISGIFERFSSQILSQAVAVDTVSVEALGLTDGPEMTLSGEAGVLLKVRFGQARKPKGQYVRVDQSPLVFLIDRETKIKSASSEWNYDRTMDLTIEQLKWIEVRPPTKNGRKPIRLERKAEGTPMEITDLKPTEKMDVGNVEYLQSWFKHPVFEEKYPAKSAPSGKLLRTLVIAVGAFDGRSYEFTFQTYAVSGGELPLLTVTEKSRDLASQDSGTGIPLKDWIFKMHADFTTLFDVNRSTYVQKLPK